MNDEQVESGPHWLVNGKRVSSDYILKDGDEIEFVGENPKSGAYRGKLGAADDGCILVSAESAARLFDLSVRSWHRMNAAGEIPAAVGVGTRSVRWDVAELKAWYQAGRPTRAKWEEQKKHVGA